MYAAGGLADELKALLEIGVNVNTRNVKGATALYFAAKNGCAEVVKVLLANGADTELAVYATGMTPYLIAVKYERREEMALLREGGCNTCARDARGRDAASIVRVYGLKLKEVEV